MHVLDRLRHPHRRRPAAAPPPDGDDASASQALIPRVQDVGAAWAPHARRALARLPGELAWAAPLLDPERPLRLVCGAGRARALLRWHHHLPTYAQVSLGTSRLGRADGRPARRP